MASTLEPRAVIPGHEVRIGLAVGRLHPKLRAGDMHRPVDLCRGGRDRERSVDELEVRHVDTVLVHVEPVRTHRPVIDVERQPGVVLELGQ